NSQQLAMGLAYYHAKNKEEHFLAQAKEAAQGRPVMIYCWRGGGRSRYSTGLLSRNGFECLQLRDGQKEFRAQVYELLYETHLELVSLGGLTGAGKSEILEYLQENNPQQAVLHIEECAAHASSVFGEIRFRLMGHEEVKNQQDFEQNLFMQMLKYRLKDGTYPAYLTEKERHRIGRFVLPPSVNEAIKRHKYIYVECPVDERARRVNIEYFGDGSAENCAAVKEKVGFLSSYLGYDRVKAYHEMIDRGEFNEFLEDILANYYDLVYKKTEEAPLLRVSNLNVAKCSVELVQFMDSYK
ncbi:MAG: hypothetical protein HRT88_19830, partial [Lentisphaeraceae bacterium]|nr:hypothetical protein [Lentisphaeraceae bacterium]